MPRPLALLALPVLLGLAVPAAAREACTPHGAGGLRCAASMIATGLENGILDGNLVVMATRRARNDRISFRYTVFQSTCGFPGSQVAAGNHTTNPTVDANLRFSLRPGMNGLGGLFEARICVELMVAECRASGQATACADVVEASSSYIILRQR